MSRIISFYLLVILLHACGTKSVPELEEFRLISNAEMPILAWYSVQKEDISLLRFKELKEAGFTHSFSDGYGSNVTMLNALNLAEEVGLKLIIATPELHNVPTETAKRFKDHPANGGYFLRDEPSAWEFEDLAAWARKIESVDKIHPCYLNLFPNYASLEMLQTSSYEEYVDRFDKVVDLPYLSFDHYPILEVGKGNYTIRPNFYENLEIISKKAKEVNKPFWAFAMVTSHPPYPIPTMAHIRFQMYSNLLYGAQGLQYFTYWTPKDVTQHEFYYGPISQDGKKTEIYDLVKKMNKEIQGLTPVFLGANVLSVEHLGDQIPQGTKAFTKLPAGIKRLEVSGSNGAIVSLLQNNGKYFFVILNRDIQQKMLVDIDLANGVKRVTKDARLIATTDVVNKIKVEPADILIYAWPQ